MKSGSGLCHQRLKPEQWLFPEQSMQHSVNIESQQLFGLQAFGQNRDALVVFIFVQSCFSFYRVVATRQITGAFHGQALYEQACSHL